MASLLEASSAYCQRLARERAKNFFYGFLLLPKPRREAFCAVYAFMRYCDDVADGDASIASKTERLHEWRKALDRALQGDYGVSDDAVRKDDASNNNLILPAFHYAVKTYSIPPQYFHDLIDGAEMDLSIRSYRTFDELYRYCYRVASVVGLCSMQMLGYRDGADQNAARKLAEECGIAFQLTNILRDLKEDAASGRIYLPLEDLERFGYSADELVCGVFNDNFAALMQFEIARAKEFYRRAYPLLDIVSEESRAALWALIAIYRGILETIERNGGNVFSRVARLTEMEKIDIVLQAFQIRAGIWISARSKPTHRIASLEHSAEATGAKAQVAKAQNDTWLRSDKDSEQGWRPFRG
jgi:phytoene synthase